MRDLRTLVKRAILWLKSPGEKIQGRVLHGGVWATGLNVSDRLIQIVRLIVLARFLPPSEFGLMGIALLTITVLKRLSEFGIEPAIIQREEENVDAYLDTAWVLKISRAILLFAVLFLSAPLIASFFGEPRAQPILRVLAVTLIFDGLENPGTVYFKKNIEFQRLFVWRLSQSLFNATVAIVAAVTLGNVWALVYGSLAGMGISLLLSYRIHAFRPSFRFSVERARDIIEFGKWMWGILLLAFFANQGDDAFVGWFLTATALGFYQVAFRLSNAPATEVSHVISQVMFPAYSQLQNDQEALRDAFSKTLRFVLFLSVPMAVGIVLVAEEFTIVVFGEEWRPIIAVMQIMAIGGLLRATSVTGAALFKGTGQPKWDFIWNLIRVVVIGITVWPLTAEFGIQGTAVSVLLGLLATLPVWAYKTADITGLSWWEYVASAGTPVIASTFMTGLVMLVPYDGVVGLILMVFLGAAAYIAFSYPIYEWLGTNPIKEVVGLGRSGG